MGGEGEMDGIKFEGMSMGIHGYAIMSVQQQGCMRVGHVGIPVGILALKTPHAFWKVT